MISVSVTVSKNKTIFIQTALSHVAATSHTEVLRFLLRFKGIEINRPDNDGNTPLHFAAESGELHNKPSR